MSAIRISPQATKDEVVAWAREQMARLGQPVPDLYTADHVLGILALFLLTIREAFQTDTLAKSAG